MGRVAVLPILILLEAITLSSSHPLETSEKDIQPRQLEIQRTPDGGYQATFSMANAFDYPGGSKGAIAATQVYNFGPKGSSSSGSHSANIAGGSNGIGFNYGQSSSQAQSQNQFGSAAANADAFGNIIQTPWGSSSNGNANAHANVNRYNNPYPYENNLGYYRKRGKRWYW